MSRKDADRVKNLDGFHSVVPYVMPKRTEAEVSTTETFDVTDLLAYIARKNATGTHLKLFHAFCTAVARTITLRPQLNIFISGRRFWQRREISLSFVAKRAFKDGAEEALMFLDVKPEMKLEDISRIILGDVTRIRENKSNDVGSLMDLLAKFPRIAMMLLFGAVHLFEFFGIMPEALRKGDPNYSTCLLSNLGSIGAGSAYHHLSNYGTCSMMVTIGTVHKEKRIMPDGTEQDRDILNATFTLDERIADGFYFAKSLRITKYLLEHPEHLNEPMCMPVPVEC